MLGRLILLLTIVPLVELVLLIQVGKAIGFGVTLALIVLTGIAGAWLARREWRSSLRRLNEDISAGRMPADALLDGLAVLIAGALLLTPGILTDVVGFGLLLPFGRAPVRSWARSRVMRKIEQQVAMPFPGGPPGAGGTGFPPAGVWTGWAAGHPGGVVVDVAGGARSGSEEASSQRRPDGSRPAASRPVLRDGDVIDVTVESGSRMR